MRLWGSHEGGWSQETPPVGSSLGGAAGVVRPGKRSESASLTAGLLAEVKHRRSSLSPKVTWESWCRTKLWDVGVQGPPGPCVQAGPGPGISWSWVRGPPSPLSIHSGQSLQPLLSLIKLLSLVV